VKLALHQPTVDLMQQHYSARGLELNEARLRMATLPSPAEEVLVTPGTWVPLVVVQGVHILPGIPKLFQSMITAHQVRAAAAVLQQEHAQQLRYVVVYENTCCGCSIINCCCCAGMPCRSVSRAHWPPPRCFTRS
jgi:molybdopterin-biosynthesis enzyme MoeA-like protein